MAEDLAMSRYWCLPPSPEVKSISARLAAVFTDVDPGPADLGEVADVHELAKKVQERKKRAELPYRDKLEKDLEADLSWLRGRVGESEAMRLVEEDWLVVGQTLVFGEHRPSYQQVKQAVSTVLERKKVQS